MAEGSSSKAGKVLNDITREFEYYLFDKGWWMYVAGAVGILFIIGLLSANVQNPFVKP